MATKYPRVAAAHFLERGVSVEVVRLAGSVELAPGLGLADCIVDVVETGRTLEENGLEQVEEVAASSARLIVNRASYHARRDEVAALVDAPAGGACVKTPALRHRGLAALPGGAAARGAARGRRWSARWRASCARCARDGDAALVRCTARFDGVRLAPGRAARAAARRSARLAARADRRAASRAARAWPRASRPSTAGSSAAGSACALGRRLACSRRW